MKVFLKSLDERVWFFVTHGWKKPKTNIVKWIKDELNECTWNNKCIYSILMEVPQEKFKRTSMCVTDKEA